MMPTDRSDTERLEWMIQTKALIHTFVTNTKEGPKKEYCILTPNWTSPFYASTRRAIDYSMDLQKN